MDKKKVVLKSLLIVCVVLVIAAVVFFCMRNNNNTEVNVSVKPINESVNLEAVFEKIKQIDGMVPIDEMHSGEELEGGPEEEKENKKTWKDEEEIDFGKYEELEKKALVNTTDDSVNEVWMIKLGNYNQQEEICRILGTRVNKLKAGFEDDALQSGILKDAVIKQEDGIVIMIISPEAREIEETIAKEMGAKLGN